jgi:hypothetical protein
MIKYLLPMFISCVVFISGCATIDTQDIKVNAEADAKANFSGYKTYAWLGTAEIVYDPLGKWEPPKFDADTEIKFLIDRELRKRGKSETSSNPDMIVAFAAGIDMTVLRLKEDPKTKIKILKNVPKGALVVAMIDASTGYVIWVGEAMGNIQTKPTDDVVRKRLDYAVSKMFAVLPK